MDKLRVLDLFSGIGGFSLGLERTGGFETVAFCEIEPFPRKVLAKHWPEVFCHHDVTTLNKETLCKGYAENALLNQLCRATGGSLASVKAAIETIKGSAGAKAQTSTTNGPQSAGEALLNIMAASALVAERPNTLFWRSITFLITATKNGLDTSGLIGKSLSQEDFQTVIKFFVTTATWQSLSTAPAPIKKLLKDEDYEIWWLTAERLAADGIAVDVICGGFPCQDISFAGKGAGLAGERSGLFYEVARLVGELEPRFVILENVGALLSRGLDAVLGTLASLGYDAEWHCIPASYLGAPHRRDRIWIIAYPQRVRSAAGAQGGCGEEPARYEERDSAQRGEQLGAGGDCDVLAYTPRAISELAGTLADRPQAGPSDSGEAVAHAASERLPRPWQPIIGIGASTQGEGQATWPLASGLGDIWRTEPDVGRVANGVPDRAHRLKALGNAVVPQIPELIGRAILAAIQDNRTAPLSRACAAGLASDPHASPNLSAGDA